MTISKKTIALLMALVLVLGAGIGGTIAWLSTQTATVTNTFVKGDIGKLTLTESDTTNISVTEGDANAKHSDFIVVPGVDLIKDPAVTFEPATTNNVPVYVFVEIVPASATEGSKWTISGKNLTYNIAAGTEGTGDNAISWTALDSAMTATVADGWTAVDGATGVYYKELPAVAAENAPNSLTKEAILKTLPVAEGAAAVTTTIDVNDNITKEQLNGLKNTDLVFKAYAIQKEGLANAAAAWAALNPTTSNTNP